MATKKPKGSKSSKQSGKQQSKDTKQTQKKNSKSPVVTILGVVFIIAAAYIAAKWTGIIGDNAPQLLQLAGGAGRAAAL